MSTVSPVGCVIDHEDEQAKYVLTDDGYWHILVKGSINGTPHPVGTRGILEHAWMAIAVCT